MPLSHVGSECNNVVVHDTNGVIVGRGADFEMLQPQKHHIGHDRANPINLMLVTMLVSVPRVTLRKVPGHFG